MSDLPSKEELVEAGAKALRGISVGNWEDRVIVATAILDAILPLVMRGRREPAIDPVTRLAIVCGNAAWDGERICPTCDGKGYVDGQ